jgi:ornithine cyclodeaminase
LLARDDARVLAICGTGVQAQAHARAIPRVRPVEEIRVAGRDRAKAEALAKEIGAQAVDSFEEAVRGADVVCATTHSPEPVVRRDWLAPGAHVTSVGVNPDGRELDEATVREARVYVESRAAALAPFPAGSNDLTGMSPEELIEIGELVADAGLGRKSEDELTLYKSVGVAVMDAAAAGLVLGAAKESGVGQEIRL